VEDSTILDFLGVGFGPANLALAVAMEEAGEEAGEKAGEKTGGEGRQAPGGRFLEARQSYAWHPDLMLEGSLIQITVLKDLVTVVNPRSRFTFLNYLKEKGRLFDFLNLRDLFPSRHEFNDYLGWVARQLSHRVSYGRRVVTVRPGALTAGQPPDRPGGKGVEWLEVEAEGEGGERETFRTRNLVLATGGRPILPPGIELPASGRAFLAHNFLSRLRRDFGDRGRPYRFLIIGSGQSGAEIFDYLIREYPQADVTAAIRRFAYKPVDESDFTNTIFFPEMVDFYYNLAPDKRRNFFDSLKDVNYAVVDHPLIRRIFRTLYDLKVQGIDRARVRNFLHLESLTDEAEGVVARFRHLMEERPVEIRADAVILAAGYEWSGPHPLLRELAPFLRTGDDGGYEVGRDYRIRGREGFAPGVYLQGHCEPTHGISETVLSLLPLRARDILSSIAASRQAHPPGGPL